MAKDKLDEIEKKKRELQAELDRIQDELDNTLDEVRTDVSSRLQPSEFVKRYPLPVVGASILVGFLAGHKKRRSTNRISQGDESGDSFSSALVSELKKFATRKAISLATDYIDSLLNDNKSDLSPSSNGSPGSEE